jgi:hypothetical protein
MNGLFEQVSAWAWWQAAGAGVMFDSAFSSTIGGYPQGAMLRTSSAGIYYLNEVENNTSDPTTGGAGWRQVWLPAGTSQSFASSASWVAPTGISRVKARIWGAGGGATYSNTTQTTGIGGGGGAYVEGYVVVSPGTSYVVSVGVGGSGGNSSFANGGNGGFSLFNGLTASGGGGATAYSAAGGGGAGSGGSLIIPGGPGAFGSSGSSLYFGGLGGTAFSSAPYPTNGVGSPGNGYTGTFPGGGGTGGVYGGNGGPGGNGLVILEW